MTSGCCTLHSHITLESGYRLIRLKPDLNLSTTQPARIIKLGHPDISGNACIPIMRVLATQLEGLYQLNNLQQQTLSKLQTNTQLNFKIETTFSDTAIPSSNIALVLAENEYLASAIRFAQLTSHRPMLVFWQLESPPPFKLQPSQFIIPGLAEEAIASIPLLEDWGIPSRVAQSNSPGCYSGDVIKLATAWIHANSTKTVKIFTFGSRDFCKYAAGTLNTDTNHQTQ